MADTVVYYPDTSDITCETEVNEVELIAGAARGPQGITGPTGPTGPQGIQGFETIIQYAGEDEVWHDGYLVTDIKMRFSTDNGATYGEGIWLNLRTITWFGSGD